MISFHYVKSFLIFFNKQHNFIALIHHKSLFLSNFINTICSQDFKFLSILKEKNVISVIFIYIYFIMIEGKHFLSFNISFAFPFLRNLIISCAHFLLLLIFLLLLYKSSLCIVNNDSFSVTCVACVICRAACYVAEFINILL